MSRKAPPVCAVCGQGGYWVGFVPELREYRCANHLDDDDNASAPLWHRQPE